MKNKTALLGITSIFSGAGMGLLLGTIMGLSVEPTVKIVMGVVTAALGAFLAFDKRNFKEVTNEEIEKENDAYFQTGLRVGSFGLAVIVGMYFGMITRTNELYAPTVEERVQSWVDAGVDRDYATKLVIFQKLGLDPQTGEQAKELSTIQKSASSHLFGAEEIQELVGALDPDLWNGDMERAIEEVSDLDLDQLTTFVRTVAETVSPENQFTVLGNLQNLSYTIENEDTDFCSLSDSPSDWQNSDLIDISKSIDTMSSTNQEYFIGRLKSALCQIETVKNS